VGRLFGAEQIRSVPLWVGRDELLTDLKADLLAGRKVLALCGQGGIGKTSLAVKLLEACGVLVAAGSLAAGCAFGRVIYVRVSEGMSFDGVMAELARSLDVSLTDGLRPEQMIDFVIKGLQRSRCLVVLDNLEDVLRDGRAIDRYWGLLLWALVEREHRSQVVITSREVPKDLADLNNARGIPNPVLVRIEKVKQLTIDEGVELLRTFLVRERDEDLRWIVVQVGGHAFVLTQLMALAIDEELDGELCRYLRRNPELLTDDVEPILIKQLSRQSEVAQVFLKRMAVMRRSADVRGLTFLRLYEDEWEQDGRLAIANNGEPMEFADADKRETRKLVEGLVKSSLVDKRRIQYQPEAVYELHPLMSELLKLRFIHELPPFIQRVQNFYQSGGKPNTENIQILGLQIQAPLLFAQHLEDKGESTYLGTIFMNQIMELERSQPDFIDNQLRSVLVTQGLSHAEIEIQLGTMYVQSNDWEKATHYLQTGLNLAIESGAKVQIAQALGLLGSIESKRGNWDKAEQLYLRSLQVREELGDRSGMASSWSALGNIESKRGNWDKAEQLYLRSLQVREELGDRSGMATSWGVLGYIESNRGNWDKAEQLYLRSLQVREELGDRSGMATSWGLLGYIESNRGNWDKAEQLYLRSLQVREELGDRSGMASSWGVLGDIERKRGNWDKAEQLYLRSLQVQEELGDRSGMATSWGVLGDIERNRGNWDKAEQLYLRSLQVEEELGDRSGMATSWGQLGYIESKRGNWDKAEQLYLRSLQVREELGDRSGMASYWGVLGDIERNRGNWDKAEQLYLRSLQVREELGDRSGMAWITSDRGANELGRGNLDLAESLLNNALTQLQDIQMPKLTAEIHSHLAKLYRAKDNPTKAQEHYAIAHQMFTQLGAEGELKMLNEEWRGGGKDEV
jgi:tetratricopeptide (TPR) repeat protein